MGDAQSSRDPTLLLSLFLPRTMTNKKIGGEYGEVRANIDGDKLNAYLKAHVPVVATPVAIKQFKVRFLYTRRATCQPSPCAEP